MKIALVQSSFKVASFEYNVSKIIDNISKARKQGAELIVFSELAISGGCVGDLADYSDFRENNLEALNTIAKQFYDVGIIIGCYIPTENIADKPYFNAACFISNGKVNKIVAKTILNDLDIADESRYFKPNSDFSLCNYKKEKFAIVISDDISVPTISEEFDINPMNELHKLRPNFVICIGAVPFDYTQQEIKQTVIAMNAARYEVPFIFVNQIGGHVQTIYDGGSLVAAKNGKIVLELPMFKEELSIIDTDTIESKSEKNIAFPQQTKIERIYHALIFGIKDYFELTGFKKAILGLSGGIDSAVTAALLVEALGKENVRGILLPSEFSTNHSISDAEKLAKKLGIKYDIVPIKGAYDTFMQIFEPNWQGLKFDVTEENLQARIRAVVLMSYSNKFNCILVNTSNKSEAAVGYGTMYGDLCGGISVLGDLYKTEVYNLANFINRKSEIIPKNSIIKAPSAELRPEQKDADSLPNYDILDKLLYAHLEDLYTSEELIGMGFEEELVNKILRLIRLNEYKRHQAPPIIRVSTRAFGSGRRMPVAW